MKKSRRRRLLIDLDVQSAILKRVAMYWAFCVLFVMTPIVVMKVLSQYGQPFPVIVGEILREYWLSFTFAALLLPLALLDALRLSHGFIGPMVRLRRELAMQAKRNDIEFRKFRDNDFWNALAVDVDRFTDELESTGPA